MDDIRSELGAILVKIFSPEDRRKIKAIYERISPSCKSMDNTNMIVHAIMIAIRMDDDLKGRVFEMLPAMKAFELKI